MGLTAEASATGESAFRAGRRQVSAGRALQGQTQTIFSPSHQKMTQEAEKYVLLLAFLPLVSSNILKVIPPYIVTLSLLSCIYQRPTKEKDVIYNHGNTRLLSVPGQH